VKRFRFFGYVVLAVALSAAVAVSALTSPRPTTTLTLLHTNDTHGHLLPFSYPETFDSGSVLARLRARRDIGGIARRAGLASRIRKDPKANVMLLDAGDVCDGTPFSTEYRGEADVAAMNAAGYDVACPGNHEFNNTLAQVRKLVSLARFPIVCANVRSISDAAPMFKPYVIRRVGPVRVAVFGLTTTDARTYPAAREGLTIDSPVERARALVPVLRRQADVVIGLTHLGIEEDRKLAVAVDGIDAIIGGHSHTYMPRPFFIGTVPGTDASSMYGTVVAHDFEWGAMLGRVDLSLTRSTTGRWSVSGYSGGGLPVTASTPVHAPTAAAVRKYWEPIREKYGRRIGIAAADFAQKGPDHAEYNLVADAVQAKTGAQVVLENMGGVRAPIARGPITYGDLVTVDPFGNTIVTMELSGEQILKVLAAKRPAVSGIRYRYRHPTLLEASIDGSPVDPSKQYPVATNSFFARDPLFANGANRRDSGNARLDAVIEYIRARGTVKPQYDRRRVVSGVSDE
jgi:2',3'-cyclic-nucleotide 2'-phosphodiesterase (5'-nucleotidase family)